MLELLATDPLMLRLHPANVRSRGCPELTVRIIVTSSLAENQTVARQLIVRHPNYLVPSPDGSSRKKQSSPWLPRFARSKLWRFESCSLQKFPFGKSRRETLGPVPPQVTHSYIPIRGFVRPFSWRRRCTSSLTLTLCPHTRPEHG